MVQKVPILGKESVQVHFELFFIGRTLGDLALISQLGLLWSPKNLAEDGDKLALRIEFI
jgi:hypothetical protein